MNPTLKTAARFHGSARQSPGRDRALSDGAAALSTLGIGLASLDSDLRYLEVNDWLASAQGLSAAEHRGRQLGEIVPHLAAQLEPTIRQVLSTGLPALDVPIQESGTGVQTARHWLVRCYPLRDEVGVGGVSCVMEEITERVRAQEALAASEAALRHSHARTRSLAGRLITAQETERTRIARELHDDVSQRLATLAIGLSSMKRELPAGCGHLSEELQRYQEWAVELADEIRNLSHELHPGVLRHAGLAAALKSVCGEVERKRGLAVSFEAAPDQLEDVPPEIALCLYRVAQETLHNAATHARARHVLVSLISRDDELELSVRDDGCGFDLGAARRKGGLGLLSIDERVRLVGGLVELTTAPGRGTTVAIRIPFTTRTGS
ncbi:MAG TPA: histidine kinase [Gemmatimonadales bacterium]|nr:histidine kinase [Gemmatimonadales bacterium]